ncbi:MAG: low affinity iron permease family protein [Alkalinema sp. CAN_BIN05]|jgi:low affinity Fe/Cu permease|nr:low affinity iron permease family protein [Alkalinema sp. CAN_BIN05]
MNKSNLTKSKQSDFFRKFSHTISYLVGTPGAFIIALTVVIVWATTGPLFNFSDTWQLVINTSTTIVTFLMVFLIQNTQSRDAKAMHLKLDELIRAVHDARDKLVDVEDASDDEIKNLSQESSSLQQRLSRNKPVP